MSDYEPSYDEASTELGQAQDASSWGQWQAATGDEWATSSESYAESAQQAYAQGDVELGDHFAGDAQYQAGLADEQYTESGYSYDTAGSYTEEAQANVDYGSSYGADTSTDTGTGYETTDTSATYETADTSSYDASAGYDTSAADTSAGYDTSASSYDASAGYDTSAADTSAGYDTGAGYETTDTSGGEY